MKSTGLKKQIFNVEWIDDDTVKLIYNDETHSGKYSEEFEIDWWKSIRWLFQ